MSLSGKAIWLYAVVDKGLIIIYKSCERVLSRQTSRRREGEMGLVFLAAWRAHNSALDLLQREMRRVFRVLAIGYGESKRMQVQALKQRFTLAEEDRHRCKV